MEVVKPLLSVVINLDNRPDRLIEFEKQFIDQANKPIRIPAFSADTIKGKHHVRDVVAACWESHKKAYEYLLNTDRSHLIIFEDDAVLTKNGKRLITELTEIDLKGIDLFQFGFLTHKGKIDLPRYDTQLRGYLDLTRMTSIEFARLNFVFTQWITLSRGLMRLIDKILIRLDIDYLGYFRNEKNLRQKLKSPQPLVYKSFEPGTHGYIIGRDFAKFLLTTNKSTFLAADHFLMGIAAAGNVVAIRVIKSQCAQSNSPSSIRMID